MQIEGKVFQRGARGVRINHEQREALLLKIKLNKIFKKIIAGTRILNRVVGKTMYHLMI